MDVQASFICRSNSLFVPNCGGVVFVDFSVRRVSETKRTDQFDEGIFSPTWHCRKNFGSARNETFEQREKRKSYHLPVLEALPKLYLLVRS